MFWDSSNGIEQYTTVIGFISKCIDNVVPTVTTHTYPNQKPWITGNIRIKLKAELPLSRSGTLIRTLIRNPTKTSDEQSNKQSVNTGLRLNPTTLALTPLDVAGLEKYYKLQRETQTQSAQWRKTTIRSKWILSSLRGKQHWSMHESTSCSGWR